MEEVKSKVPYNKTKNLIKYSDMTPEERHRFHSNGGKGNKNNPNSKIAARLREMRKKGLNDEGAQWLHDMMTDNKMAAMRILEKIGKLWKSDNDKDINFAMKTTMDWYKLHHGTAESNKKIEVNVNILNPQEREKEVLRLLG